MATQNQNIYYNGNKNLKNHGVVMNYTQDQLNEWAKCAADPIYFIKTYVKIVHVDRGIIPFELYPFQERIINAYVNNRKVICKIGRQQGKTQTTAAFFLWFIIFHDVKLVGIMANKAAVAREILSRIQFSYEGLPFWMQPGVKEWNKGSIELSNGSGIITAATSPNAIRGFSVSALYIDETAFIPPNIAEEFFTSVFPTISSGKDTRIYLSSTPKGLNHYHKMWVEAEQGTNGFFPVAAEWHENPSRDEKWRLDQLQTLGELKYNQEVLCQFMGSSKTLLNGATLMALTTVPPIFIKDKLEYFKQPVKGRNYVITVDTSRGRHLDFSALTVIDITSLPYEVVATYKDNEISPESYPHLIYTIAKSYNDAYVLIEVNDLGEMISSNLFYEFEYENVYFTFKDVLNEGRGYPGIRTTKKVKAIGCATLKSLMEQDQLIINSHKILTEFGVFSQKGASYAADDEEINDDLMTCLWLFAWLTKQPLFAELTDTNIRSILAKKTEQYIDENMLPFGFIDDGRDAVGDIDVMQRVGGGADWMQKWLMSDLQPRD
jgi:hypothetical protein